MSHTLPASPLPCPGGEPAAPLEACVVASPDAAAVGARLPLDGRPRSIGRAGAADLEVDDGRMTRLHAVLRAALEAGAPPVIQDLGSRNGVFVDGRRRHEAPLADGAVLRLGDTLLVVHEAPLEEQDEGALRGVSSAMQRVRRSIARVAPSELTVLLRGETGTGKELAAAEVHRLSSRGGELVAINCAAIPEGLAESALFGHARGSFTGATERREGVLTRADGGTLFLDEVGELPLAIQGKLLRVLEDWEVTPVGGTRARRVDVRVVAATNADLATAVEEGRFRADLLARLEEWPLELPPLRRRRADICHLLGAFLGADGPGQPSADAAEALLLHDWPFNVRGLLKLARRLRVALDPGQHVTAAHLPAPVLAALEARRVERAADLETDRGPREITRERCVEALRGCQGNVTRAARHLGCGRKTLYRRLAEHGIDPARFRT